MRYLLAGAMSIMACTSDGGKTVETPASPAEPGAPEAEEKTMPEEKAAPLAGATQVVWRFRDSSVPPEYHRSYVITVTPASIRKVVDSYGKVLGDESAPFDQARFDRVLAAIAKHGLAARPPAAEESGCSGGTSHGIEVTAGASVLLAGEQDHCGGRDAGSLAGDARAFDAELAALAPAAGDGPAPAVVPAP